MNQYVKTLLNVEDTLVDLYFKMKDDKTVSRSSVKRLDTILNKLYELMPMIDEAGQDER